MTSAHRNRCCLPLALGCVCLLGGCKSPDPPPEAVRPARVIRAGDVEAIIGRKFPGRTRATQEVDLSFRVGGTIASLQVLVGDEVEQGQTVAQLDPRDFEVNVRSAEASLGQAKASLGLAREEHRRARDALEKGAATELEVTRRREAENGAAAQVAAAEATLERARNELEYTTLAAPFEGTVTARFVESFEDVLAKEPIVRILDDSRIEMVVDIPEQLMALSGDLAAIRVAFDAFPGLELEATIKERGTEADPVTRTYPITLIMDQPPDARVLPGMTGQAWAVRPAAAAAEGGPFELPLSAVGGDTAGGRFVWVVDEKTGVVARRSVEVIELTPVGVLVSGLERGELVATAGAAFLREGQQVRPDVAGAGGAAGTRGAGAAP